MGEGELKIFQKGERIISEGDPALVAYMVLHGRVRVFLEKEGKQVKLAELESGSLFGENALFGGHEYGACVEAMGDDTKLIIVTPARFKEKIESSDPMLKAIIEMLIERQRATNEALLESETREFMDIQLI